MENRESRFKVISLIAIPLIVIAIILCFLEFRVSDMSLLAKINTLVTIVGLISGAFYLISGFKKAGANFYKIYIYLFTLSEALSLVNVFTEYGDSFLFIGMQIVIVGLLIILSTVKDLGKDKSMMICGLLILLKLVYILFIVKAQPDMSLDIVAKTYLYRVLSKIVMGYTLFVITYGKYVDKQLRGRE